MKNKTLIEMKTGTELEMENHLEMENRIGSGNETRNGFRNGKTVFRNENPYLRFVKKYKEVRKEIGRNTLNYVFGSKYK